MQIQLIIYANLGSYFNGFICYNCIETHRKEIQLKTNLACNHVLVKIHYGTSLELIQMRKPL